MEQNKRKRSLLTLIMCGMIAIIVCAGIVGTILGLQNREEVEVKEEVELASKQESLNENNETTNVYDKYEEEGIAWLVRDAEATYEKYPNGTSVILSSDENFEDLFDSYVVNSFEKFDYNDLDGEIKLITFPNPDDTSAVYIITDKGTLYSNYDAKISQYFDFKKIIEFNSEVIDVFQFSEKIREYKGMYFLLSNGKLINEDGTEYEVFNDGVED